MSGRLGRRLCGQLDPSVRAALSRASSLAGGGGARTILAPSAAALSATPAAGLPVDQLAVVETYGALFTLTAAGPALAADVVLPASDGRVWQRGPSLIAPAAARQGDWYVDPATGSNEGAGTLGAPLESPEEITRRIGTWTPSLPYAQDLRIFLLSSQPPGADPIVFEPFLPGGGTLSLIGTLSAVGAPFAAGTVTAKVRAAGASPLSVAGFPGAASAYMLVANTTRGSLSIIDAIAGGVASLCQPFESAGLTTIQYPIQGGVGVFVEDDTWAAGDLLQLYAFPRANLKRFQGRGADANPHKPVVWIQNLYVPDPSGTPGQSLFLLGGESNSVTSCCVFEPLVISNIYSAGIGIDAVSTEAFISCVFVGGAQFRTRSIIGGATHVLAEFQDGSVIDGDIILHDTIYVKGRYSDLGYALVAPGALITVDHGAVLLLEEEWIPGGNCLYGNKLAVNGPNSAVLAGDYPNQLKMTTLALDGASVGTARAGSTWTDGIALTSANIQSNGGLQNTGTGSRFAT
jgi:hypothetical protein